MNRPTKVMAYLFDNDKRETNQRTFDSIKAAADAFGMKYTTFAPMINRAIKRNWFACGYLWKRLQA